MVALQARYAKFFPPLERPPTSYGADQWTAFIATRMGALWGFIGGVLLINANVPLEEFEVLQSILGGGLGAIAGGVTARLVAYGANRDTSSIMQEVARRQFAVASEFARHAEIIDCVAALSTRAMNDQK